LGCVTIPVIIGGLQLFHTFYVLPDMPFKILLGVDFLQKHRCEISWEAETLTVQSGLTQTPLMTRADTCSTDLTGTFSPHQIALIRITQDLLIPAHTESLVPLPIKHKSINRDPSTILLLESTKTLV
jgi:hypothetical protein